MAVANLLERDLAVQLPVERHKDGAQAASGVLAQDLVALGVAGCGIDGVTGNLAGEAAGFGRVASRSEAVERGVDVRVAEIRECGAS